MKGVSLGRGRLMLKKHDDDPTLNLEGLPNLVTLRMFAESGCEASSRLLSEICELVARECQELPGWAKPVMRKAVAVGDSEPLSDEKVKAVNQLCDAVGVITPEQRKEIEGA